MVANGRECVFGEIVDGKMALNALGEIAKQEWFRTSELRGTVRLYEDEFVVMPNHVHGIVWIIEGDDVVGAQRRCAPTDPSRVPMYPTRAPTTTTTMVQRTNVAPGSLGAIIRAYKSAVTHAIHALQGSNELPVWQRNYYEHIIRNDEEYRRIQMYIESNPANWVEDDENPARWV
jgi:REP element-mobilizing transposase RayT